MVAISMYRGNLHRVPEIERRWVSLSPKISMKNFKKLLNRRSVTLSGSIPNPNSDVKPKLKPIEEEKEQESVDNNCPLIPINGSAQESRINGGHADGDDLVHESKPQITHILDALSETEKKKNEIEEKLEVLNAKKHDLVQVLKQILNAEEELKRRSSTQGMDMRPSIPLQVDVTNESGSLSKLTTPRLNSDGNVASDIERGEADDTSHTYSRHLVRPSSISPSSDSLHRRPAFSAVPHPRASLGEVGSPSRFAPVGHSANLPIAVSSSGTNYIMSSPSPAASGTSAFRDNRQPSPWH